MYHAAVLTVSDRVSRGERPDEGGPLVAELLKNAGYEVVRTDVVPDEQAQIEAALRQMADDGDIQLLVTTGGTGFAPRDVTPEATLAVCDRLTPGAMPPCRSPAGPCCPGRRRASGKGP